MVSDMGKEIRGGTNPETIKFPRGLNRTEEILSE
jgi:hypothetical protein